MMWPSLPRHTEVISEDVLDCELNAFQAIRRNLVLACADLISRNNLLGGLHCQAILHTPLPN